MTAAQQVVSTALSTESVAGQVLAINQQARESRQPKPPETSLTTKEKIETYGLLGAESEWFVVSFVAALLSVPGVGIASGLSVAGLIMVLPIVVGVFALSEGLGRSLQSKAVGKFWTRVVRKQHYLRLHQQEKSQQEIAQQAYEQALAKHQKVMKRLRKRSAPIIEAYNEANPQHELVLTPKGLKAQNRYTPAQSEALAIAAAASGAAPTG